MWCYNDAMGGALDVPIVLDTNVLFEGMTRKDGASALIVDGWRSGVLKVGVCDALAYEYFDVLSRKLSSERWRQAQPALRELLLTARFVTVRFTWRPSSPDPGDEHVIDCAMNANAFLITWNVKDFRRAVEHLHLVVMTPPDYVCWVGSHLPESVD